MSDLIIDNHMWKRIIAVTDPHIDAIKGAVTAAFPDNPEEMYTVALALHLGVILHILDIDRKLAVDTINAILVKANGYKLIDSAQTDDDGAFNRRKTDGEVLDCLDVLNCMTASDPWLKRVAALSDPHMTAIIEAVPAAFPDNNSNQMLMLAYAINISTLLHTLPDTDREHAVHAINTILAKTSGSRLERSQ
jgi:hypothetical protein